jgi:phosphotriesterase-related protein
MRAVAQAHAETGAPIMVHNRPAGNTMAEVRRVLGEEGVDPRRVQLAHVGDSTDVDLLAGLAEEGFLLGMDRFGIDPILGFEDRVATVVELCRRGWAHRMVLAHDASCYIDWIQPDLLQFMPNWNFLHIHQDVVPALLERGVTQDQIDQMLVSNPRDWFERT